MRKSTKTLGKVLFTSALTAALAAGMGVTAFAVNANVTTVDGGSQNTVATADATTVDNKLHIAAEGVTIPDVTYTYTITGVNGAPVSARVKTISFASSETVTSDIIEKKLENVFKAEDFNHTGIYTYKITQTATAVSGGTLSNDVNAISEYTVNVKVVTDTTDPENPILKIKGVAAYKTTDGNEQKVENIVFDNTYEKTSTLNISKALAGESADYGDEFTYTITFTNPDADANVNLLDDNLKLNTNVALNSNTVAANADLAYGTEYTFVLKGGEDITFNVPAGIKYTLTEAASETYTAKASVVENGGTAAEQANSAVNTALTLTNKLAGESGNTVVFTNTKAESPLTGLLTDNAPFIAMVSVAGVAFVAYVAYKRRRTAE